MTTMTEMLNGETSGTDTKREFKASSHSTAHLVAAPIITVRHFLVLTVTLLYCLFLLFLAERSRAAFEVCATFFWYSCFTFVMWCALRDTSAQSVMESSQWRFKVMHALLVAVPIATTIPVAFVVILAAPGGMLSAAADSSELGSGAAKDDINEIPLHNAREITHILVEFVGVCSLYLIVPLVLYYFRIQIAKELAERRAKSSKVLELTRELRVQATIRVQTGAAMGGDAIKRSKAAAKKVEKKAEDAARDLTKAAARAGAQTKKAAAHTKKAASGTARKVLPVEATGQAFAYMAVNKVMRSDRSNGSGQWRPFTPGAFEQFANESRYKAIERAKSKRKGTQKSKRQKSPYEGTPRRNDKKKLPPLEKSPKVVDAAERQQRAEDDFLAADADGSGTIDEEELLALFEKLMSKSLDGVEKPDKLVLTEYMQSFRISTETPLDLDFDAFVKVYNSFLDKWGSRRPSDDTPAAVVPAWDGETESEPAPAMVVAAADDGEMESPREFADGPSAAEDDYKNSTVILLRAATKLQTRFRMRQARKRFKHELQARAEYLAKFDLPIFLATLIDIFGSNLVLVLVRRGRLPTEWNLYSIFFTIPSIIVAFLDLRRPKPPRFSLSHCIFLVAVLYRLALRAATIDRQIYLYLLGVRPEDCDVFESTNTTSSRITGYACSVSHDSWESTWVPLITMVCHFVIFITVTAMGKLSLTMVATKNAATHLLFPFQMFDYLFLYAFFSLRWASSGVQMNWLAQQLLMQIFFVMRNAGINAAMGRQVARLFGIVRLKKQDPNDDPLFRLQNFARIGIQFDLADVTALILTPAFVSFVVSRDGWFTMEDSGILVTRCDLPNMWLRFIALLIIKPTFSTLARLILMRAMRKTLLGKSTIHGTSTIAAGILASKQLVQHKRLNRHAGGTPSPAPSAATGRTSPTNTSPRSAKVFPVGDMIGGLLPTEWNVGDAGFMHNPKFAQGTRIRETPDKAAPMKCAADGSGDLHIKNGWQIEVVEVDGDFLKVRNEVDAELDGWVLKRNVKKPDWTEDGTEESIATTKAKAKNHQMMRLDTSVDLGVQAKLGLLEEELMSVKGDFELAGLNFRLLRLRQMRKWRYFSAVAIIQCFAAFPLRNTAPLYDEAQTDLATFMGANRTKGLSVFEVSKRWDPSTHMAPLSYQHVWATVPVEKLAKELHRLDPQEARRLIWRYNEWWESEEWQCRADVELSEYASGDDKDSSWLYGG